MNFRSGKFSTPVLGKLIALAREHPFSTKIGGAVNLTLSEFSASRICCAGTFLIDDCDQYRFGAAREKSGNLLRYKFPALKIKTVENGSIRQ